MMTLNRLSDLLRPERTPTELERQAIVDVMDEAERFDAGMCTLAEVRAATSPRQRHLATRFSTPTDRAWPALMRLLDALIAEQKRAIVTNQGTFLLGDLIDAGMKIVHEDGREVIQFPDFWPWRVKPDPDLMIEGVRGEPHYRQREKQAPAQRPEHDREWWEEAHDE